MYKVMKLDIKAGSHNDEFYTPRYAIKPIVKYLKEKGYKHIWCPFDTKESLYVKVLSEKGFEVTHSHISDGEDFFDTHMNVM